MPVECFLTLSLLEDIVGWGGVRTLFWLILSCSLFHYARVLTTDLSTSPARHVALL